MAKAKKKHSTSGKPPPEQPPEANPHFLGRFTPTRPTVSPLYRQQQDSLETMTKKEQRDLRSLEGKAARSGLSNNPPPPSGRGVKRQSDEAILPQLRRYVDDAERRGQTRTAAIKWWLKQNSEGPLDEKALHNDVKRLRSKL